MTIRFNADDVINTIGNNPNPNEDPFAVSAQVRQEAEVRYSQQQLQTDKVDRDQAQARTAAEHAVASGTVRVAPTVNATRPEDGAPMYAQVPVNIKA